MKTPSLRLSSLALALALALAGALTLLAGGCGKEPAVPELLGEPACRELVVDRARAARNVILVLNDAMRRDALGIYGGAAKTPHFDEFAREHLVFDHAVSQAPWTKPSIATLFTSLYPSQHRVESHPFLRAGSRGSSDGAIEADVLAPSLVTLAEVLRESGMRTGAVIGNPWMVRDFGFYQGFDVYDDSFGRWHTSGNELVDAGLEWIESLDEDERFFLYLHTVDSHRPYGHVSGADHAALRATYNGDRQLTARQRRVSSRQSRCCAQPTRAESRSSTRFWAACSRRFAATKSSGRRRRSSLRPITANHSMSAASAITEEACTTKRPRFPWSRDCRAYVWIVSGLPRNRSAAMSYSNSRPESESWWVNESISSRNRSWLNPTFKSARHARRLGSITSPSRRRLSV